MTNICYIAGNALHGGYNIRTHIYPNQFQNSLVYKRKHNQKTHTDLLSAKTHQKEKKDYKHMKSSTQQFEGFGIAFGAAWNTASH